MFTTPRKGGRKGGGRSAPGSSSREPRKGLFENGQWFCDCEPRLPAIHLQTKKKGKNNGRWFYTCQKDRKEQCGFFLFEDAAQAREKEYLLNGGKEKEMSMIQTHIGPSSPPLPPSLTLSYASQQASGPGFAGSGSFTLPSGSTGNNMDPMRTADNKQIKVENEDGSGLSQARPSVKRKRGLFVDDSDEDEFGGGIAGDLNSDEEREMVALAESAVPKQLSLRGRDYQQAGQFTTPTAQRTHDVLNGLATPNTGNTVGRNSLLIATEQRELDAKRQKMEAPATPSPMQTGDSSNSSSTARQRPPESSAGGAGADDYPITEEVMALLGGGVSMLDDDVVQSVRRKLNNYALRMKGVERGRDMVRSAVQARDARIAELQARVVQLEKERGADRERIKTLAGLVKDMS